MYVHHKINNLMEVMKKYHQGSNNLSMWNHEPHLYCQKPAWKGNYQDYLKEAIEFASKREKNRKRDT